MRVTYFSFENCSGNFKSLPKILHNKKRWCHPQKGYGTPYQFHFVSFLTDQFFVASFNPVSSKVGRKKIWECNHKNIAIAFKCL